MEHRIRYMSRGEELTNRPGIDGDQTKRVALLTALFLIFVASALTFRFLMAAPPDLRTTITPERQFAVVWEAWRALETASGTHAPSGPGAAARAVEQMALVANVDPTELPARLEKVTQRPPSSVPQGLDDVWRAWRVIHSERPKTPTEAVVRAAIQGLAGEDPAARYLDSSDYEGARDYFQGAAYEGIGAWVGEGEDNGKPIVFISETMPDSPAAAAGLRRGDIILSVNGQSIEGLVQRQVVEMVRGPRGTEVQLQVRGLEETETRTVKVTRGLVNTPSLQSDISGDGMIGYIRILVFQTDTGTEFRQTLRSLLDQGIKGLVLDMRNNPGGSLRGATAVASEFLEDGIVMYEISNEGKREEWPVESNGIAQDLPLVVVVNEYSASAAEVVAGALQDRDRAKLYGTTTYGKGSVQQFQELSNGGALYATVSHWYTPGGRQIQDSGIAPDIQILAASPAVDVQLYAAYSDLKDLLLAGAGREK